MKQKGILLSLIIAVFVTILLSGCLVIIEDDDVDVSGTWYGWIEIEGAYGYLELDLYQDGDDVGGDATMYDGDEIFFYDLSVDGEVSGDEFEGSMTADDPETYNSIDNFFAEVDEHDGEMDGELEYYDEVLEEWNYGTFSLERE